MRLALYIPGTTVAFLTGYLTHRYNVFQAVRDAIIYIWQRGILTRFIEAFCGLSVLVFVIFIPVLAIAIRESQRQNYDKSTYLRISARDQLRRRGMVRVFWPVDCEDRRAEPSILIGFRNAMSDFMVVTALPEAGHDTIRRMLSNKEVFTGTPYDATGETRLLGFDMSTLGIIGSLNSTIEHEPLLRVTTAAGQRYPQFSLRHVDDISFQVIFFERPLSNRLQYFSFIPITLELVDSRSTPAAIEEDEDDFKSQAKKKVLISAIQKATVFGFPSVDTEKNGTGLWISQINSSHELQILLHKAATCSRGHGDEERSNVLWRTLCISAGMATNLLSLVWSTGTMLSIWSAIAFLIIFRALSEAVLVVIEWNPKSVNLPALKDLSATIQQLDLRLQQICYWPIQYITLRNQNKSISIRTSFHAEYIRFYNSLWLVANDIIIGAAFGSYVIDNRDYIVSFVDFCIDELLTKGLRQTIEWLMDWPGGLKLNNELVAFFGELFLWVIEFWSGTLQIFRPFMSEIVYAIGLSGFIGATFPIAMIADMVSFLTIQIYSCYLASARIYNWQLTVLLSLFQLFRGKRRNVLRKRIDSCDYDLDQLLLGTLLFTLLTFLLPTVLVFYLTFASARLCIIVINAMLESTLALLNHFPLFAMMLRLKDSKRLPGGLEFDVCEWTETQTESSQKAIYIQLRPVALPVRAMFQQYLVLSKRIQKHYLSERVVVLLLTGQFVPIQRSRLYSLQYSMLPEKRVGLRALWRQMREFGGLVWAEVREKLQVVQREVH
ncbi:N-acetylglucosaminyl transferase component-domain-containing protein [Limtongia smithiae]|uniref:N-acetylglucosaminyl transferase component-domain-containing protein n=1 Tax=Limtongia smithiae TaxID=1125753 RepID=UPI0034D01878